MTGKNATETLLADEAGIAKAVQLLKSGGIVAVPTETVYGLAARADSDEAVARIYEAKGRPSFNPLIVHVGSVQQAQKIARFDERAKQLADRFWPGPLTMVLPLLASSRLAGAVTAGLPTIALRQPAHPAMQAVLAASELPLAAPSANQSGGVSPTEAKHAASSLGEAVDLILDGGRCDRGLESTIVALRDDGSWQLLRHGPIAEAELIRLLGKPVDVVTAEIEAPGQLANHYSPGKPIRLEGRTAQADEFHIGFGDVAGDVNLSASGDLLEAASRLYSALHQAAGSDKLKVAVAPIPKEDLGAAINDRLKRAAAT
ncbi:L-threonylcarbamoyladenylate synthase [Altererythrobacter sp. ZODW24]|uniref:L-threonylcarbamoyladenylate synthase n=1 Tax=Altererythrobacter sp. ZODW24 TaxID=2185142 RepID=UPI000DF80CF4|nr:L-threonylcarbamoyladenylate synthase [Altererythrobacter sp. ZODW24]